MNLLQFFKHLFSTLVGIDFKLDLFCPDFDGEWEAIKKSIHLYVMTILLNWRLIILLYLYHFITWNSIMLRPIWIDFRSYYFFIENYMFSSRTNVPNLELLSKMKNSLFWIFM